MTYNYFSEDYKLSVNRTITSRGASLQHNIGGKIYLPPSKKTQKSQKPNGSNQVYSYRLGPREGNTRIVGTDSISTNITRNLTIIFNGTPTTSIQPSRPSRVSSSDGSVGSSVQGTRGDCFFLAEINAIRNTQCGQIILDKNIRKNSDGSVTVTLPGAIKIRQEYAAKGLKCEVTGTYVITADAIAKAEKLAGKSFSKNDMDTICLEIAMENYRAEMIKTNELNGNKENSGNYTAEGAVAHLESKDLMWGGQSYDAGFLLTGKKSDVYRNGKKYANAQRYSDGQYGYITKDQMIKETNSLHSGMKSKGISEINHLGKEEKDLDNMLNKCQGHEEEYAITCSVRIIKPGQDKVTPKDSGHALTVVKITDDTVYVSNPWHPDKIEPIPRKEFVKMAYGMSAMQVQERRPQQSTGNNSNDLLNAVIGKLSSNHTGIKPPNKINPSKLDNLINKINHNSQNNHSNININKFIQMMNKATTSNLSDEDKTKLNNLLNSISFENTNETENLEDFSYLYNKYMK